jgi:tetratricopeptide (TPR) repeat protein
LAGGLLVLAALVAWRTSFSGAFVFDDFSAIVDNPTIRHLWPVWATWLPRRADLTVSGRPFLNFTLAISHALSGSRVWGYHAVNLALHLLAGLTLFGIVWRTLGLVGRVIPNPPLSVSDPSNRRVKDNAPYPANATLLAFTVALLWTLHPLQTEAVTYIIQRAESLMGLLFLLTLYCFIRSVGSPRAWLWQGGAVAACLLGSATKEVIAMAPLLVLLYDRTFVAGTFRDAWRRRWRLHLALMATWLPLAWLVAGTGWSRGSTAGFGVGIAPGAYWLTQCDALTRYLGLSFWPCPLVADYGMTLVRSVGPVLPQALLLLLLAAGTAVSLWRRPALGFLGAWFFAILAPTSIVPVATQTMAEHRMYLPLAAVVTLAVIGTHRLVGRRCLLPFLALAVGLGWLTLHRNDVYRSELSLWGDVAAKRPENARAYINLGNLSLAQSRVAEAIARYETALRLQPNLPEAESNLSNALAQAGRPAEAVGHGEAALRLKSDFPDAHINLGNALMQLGRTAEAIAHYEAALRFQPDAADTQVNLGDALRKAGHPDEAIAHYEAALRVEPDRAETEYALAGAFMGKGDGPAALRHYTAAVRLKPGFIGARFALGNALAEAGRFADAIAEYQAIIRLDPRDLPARNNLGNALMTLGRLDEAIAAYEDALRLQPDNPSVRENLRLAHALREETKRTP